MLCPECANLIPDSSPECKYCNHTFPNPKRPTGLTILAVYLFISGALSLIGAFTTSNINSALLGSFTDTSLTSTLDVLVAVIGIWCGYGFLKQLRISWNVYIGLSIFGILNTLFNMRLLDQMLSQGAGTYLSPSQMAIARMTSIVTIIIILAVHITILVYLFKMRKYFFR